MRKSFSYLWFVGLVFLLSCTEPTDAPQETGKRALIIVDMQYDFLPGGALETTGGDKILKPINDLQSEFELVVATQDWHPKGHGSFASSHPGRGAGEVIDLNGLEQVLWPDHAIQDSDGAKLSADLDQSRIARVFQKGMNPEVDSYSGFFDNGHRGDTGLDAYLKGEGVTQVYVVGLALDYCVKYTALDAKQAGYETTLIVDASRAVNLKPEDGEGAIEMMNAAGINIINSSSLLNSMEQ